MAEQSFTVRYEGPALVLGSMDVRQLAPALLALGELYQETQRILYPGEQPLALEVKATDTGSFVVHLQLVQSLWQQAVELFSGDGATAIANVLAYTTAAGGVIGLLITLHRSRIRSRTEVEPGMIRLIFEDGTVYEVSPEVLKLAESLAIRRAVKEVFAPLEIEGIDTVSITGASPEPLVVTKRDIPAFELPPVGDELINDTTQIEVLSLAAVAFADGNKWRLTDGDRTFFAAVADNAFLDQVSRDEIRFAKHDLLRVRLRTQQWRTDGGLRTEYTVVQVTEHMAAARAVPLPLEYIDPPADSA
jgi:hypothetical protein